MSVTEIFGDPVISMGVVEAMTRGFLSDVNYRLKCDNLDQSWVSSNSMHGYTIRQLNKKLFIPERDEHIIDEIMGYWRDQKPTRGIVFCNSSLHAEKIERMLRATYGLEVRSLTTRVKDKKERARRLRDFRTGAIKVLTCYDLLNEGIDVPDVDFLVYLRVTHSRTIFLQQLGRGLRLREGKKLLVLDYVADLRRLDDVCKLSNDLMESTSSITQSGVEEIGLPAKFELTFSDQATQNFIQLVELDQYELGALDIDDNF